MNMKKYEMVIHVSDDYCDDMDIFAIEIEAKNEKEARKRAENEFNKRISWTLEKI
jgi:hypothetical protein